MAAIDKIYCSNVKDWEEFHNWCIRNKKKCWSKTRKKILSYFYVDNKKDFEDWLDSVIKTRKIQKEVLKNALKDRNSDEFYRQFSYVSNSVREKYGDYTTESYRKVCTIDEDYVKRMEEYVSTDELVDADIPIVNLPSKIDKWLIKHCPVKFVRNRLKEQYGMEFDKIKTRIFK